MSTGGRGIGKASPLWPVCAMRAGVRPDISERVLGHVIAGVEGTYVEAGQSGFIDRRNVRSGYEPIDR